MGNNKIRKRANQYNLKPNSENPEIPKTRIQNSTESQQPAAAVVAEVSSKVAADGGRTDEEKEKGER